MKFTKPSPATWFENVLIYGTQVKKPKTKSKWRNPSPATWMWIRNCQKIYQTNSSNLIWNCFDIWNSGRKAKNRVEMTEPSPATWMWMRNCQEIYQTKSSNLIWKCFDIWSSCRKAENRVEMTEPKSSILSVNEKLSRNVPNQVQQLDLKLFWYMEFRSKSRKQSWNDGNQVQQLECEWEIVKNSTKPSPATWFESVLIYGIQVKKPKTKSKRRKPSPATWLWIKNTQEMYQTKSSNLIWNCFDIWNSGRRAENRVEMTEPKSSNLSVIEKFSWKSPNQVQQLDLKMFWYMEFMSKSRKQSWNDGTQVQQLECEWEIVKKFTKPSPAIWFERVLIYGIQVKKPKKKSKWRKPSPTTWLWIKNTQEMYQTKSSNLIWNCFDIWNSGRRAENGVEMTEPKSSSLSVIEKFSWNSPNQVQQFDLSVFWYMEFKSKSQKKVKMTETKSNNLIVNKKYSRNVPNQVQQLDLKLFWYMEFRLKSRKQSWNDGTQVQQLECDWEILMKFTKPSPATWFENVLIYGTQVKKPKTKSKWRNPSPATWMWIKNCQEIYQTNSSNLIWNCFDIWNSGRKAKNRVEMTEPSPATWVWMRNCQEIYQTKSSNLIWECFDIWNSSQKAKNNAKMTEPKSSNLIVNEKYSRNVTNRVQQLDLKLVWYMEFRSKSQKQSWNDGTQVQQFECDWEILMKFTKPSPATWFENVLIYGIHVKKPKTELKWRNPSPATWVWIRNCQQMYQTKSSNFIWEYFDIWNSSQKAKNKVKKTETKSSNLIVNKKYSRNVPDEVQQLDLKLFWYMEFRSKSRKQSWNDGTQVQQLECEWQIVKKCTKPSPATWFESVLIYGIQVKKPKTMPKWRNPSPATWLWIKNTQEMYQTKSSNLIWNCFDIWNSGRRAENRVEMTEPKSSNLSVIEKFSWNSPNQVQQLDLKMFWYMEFMSNSRK